MRLEVVHHDGGREKAYVLEDAASFILEADSLGDVSLRADACDGDACVGFRR